MARKSLYVGNLAPKTTDADLRQLFGLYGTVTSAEVILDSETGRSRGFGFVEMADGADQAIKATNGAEFQNRKLKVNVATPRDDKPRADGGRRGRS